MRIIRNAPDIFVLIGLVIVVLSASPASAKRWYEYYQQAEAAMKNKEWERAITLLNQAIADDPKSGKRKSTYGTRKIDYYPYLKLGIAYLQIGDTEAAQRNCSLEQKQGAAPKNELAPCLPSPTLPPIATETRNLILPSDSAQSQADSPALEIPKKENLGQYYALVIGNNAYHFLNKLVTAKSDAQAIADVLKLDYGFQVTTLFDATRNDILKRLNEYRRTLTAKDNLLIYYAGHGQLDPDSGEGYWLPVDAETDNNIDWIQNDTIRAELKALPAKHVLIVSDSCYSGTLTRSANVTGLKSADYLLKLAQKKTRIVIASGGLEVVSDSGGEAGHSVFASAFLQALQENAAPVIDMMSLFPSIRARVMINAEQEPVYSDIRGAGGEVGGDFLFVRTPKP